MNTQSENTEPKISKDELSDNDLTKVTGGDAATSKPKSSGTAGGNVAAKWSVSQNTAL